MIDPLSEREVEVLRLIADGFSNEKISQKLFLALSTVKGHNLRIFGKLQVKSRTEAVARARDLGLLYFPQTILHNNTFVSKRHQTLPLYFTHPDLCGACL